jgi:hypothetical protein
MNARAPLKSAVSWHSDIPLSSEDLICSVELIFSWNNELNIFDVHIFGVTNGFRIKCIKDEWEQKKNPIFLKNWMKYGMFSCVYSESHESSSRCSVQIL